MNAEHSAAPATMGAVTGPQRKGDWMQVASGRKFWPLDPRADEVCIEDVAHGLSMLCRFGGHVQRFYSVAEHSVWCSRIVPPEHALQALMHDATEAYCVDIPRPLKRGLSNYAEIEAGIWSAVCDRFDLVPDLDATVKVADNAMCLAEARQIMTSPEIDWSATGEAASVKVECWSPEEGRRRFLERFAELAQARGSCFLCAGKCRSHGLGDAEAWQPEAGSAAALARAKHAA